MNRRPIPERPRYHNAVVFRSAERLLASKPPKVRRHWPTRWNIFLVGMGCGLGVAFLLFRKGPDAGVDGDSSPARMSENHRGLAGFLAGLKPTFGIQAKPSEASVSGARDRNSPSSTPEDTSSEESAISQSQNAPIGMSDRSQPSRENLVSAAPPISTTFVTHAVTAFRLRGELRTLSAAPIQLEIDLRLTPDRLTGFAEGALRFLDEPGRKPINLSGTWVNRTFSLRETDKISPNFDYPRDALTLIVEFPESDRADEITGLWTQGATIGRLSLRSIAPW